VARTCSVCGHPERQGIDQALAAHEPYRDIAGRFGTSKSALHRHRHTHAPGPPSLEVSATLVDEARRLHAEALELAYHPARVVELLRRITGLLLQVAEASTPPQP
jgi:hypothetical protein